MRIWKQKVEKSTLNWHFKCRNFMKIIIDYNNKREWESV